MFKRLMKWAGMGAGALLVLAVLASVVIYIASEREVRRVYDVPTVDIQVPQDSASIEKGRRLATLFGCNNSCHGRNMEGNELYDEPGIAKINAPNLTRVVREYTDAQLERLIRHGVKRDGRSTWIMPSPMFSRVTDEDLGAVIAFLRAQPEREGPMREVTLRPLGRLGIVLGKFRPLASQIDPQLQHAAHTDRTDSLAYGKYLVMTTCTECHGPDLQGSDIVHAPSLIVTAGYSKADFDRLMRTGIAVGNRKLGLMTEVAETRFPNFTDDEVDAIRRYLEEFYRS